MAISFTNAANGLTRSAAFISNASDWTRTAWFNPIISNPTGSQYRTYFLYGDLTYTNPFIWVGSNVDTGDIFCVVFDGATQHPTAAATVALDTWFTWGLTYNSSSHALKFYVNAVLVATLTINLGSITFVQTDEYLATDTTSATNIAVTSFAEWQLEFALVTLIRQWQTSVAFSSSSLLAFTPLSTLTDLADTSGNGRNWTNIASAGATVTGPFPTNNLSSAAIDLGTAPNTLTQAIDAYVVTPDVWYKYTKQTGDNELGIFAFGDLSNYKPTIEVLVGTLPTLVDYHFGFNAQNRPIQIPIESAHSTYYFRIHSNTPTTSPSNLSISIKQGPGANPLAATILIPDDSNFLPAGLISIVDGTPKAFIQEIVNSENGDVLNNGNILLINSGSATITDDLVLYDKSLVLITTISLSNSHLISANRTTDQFWVVRDGTGISNPKFYTVSPTGTLSSLIATINTTNFILDVAISIDDQIAYYVQSSPYEVKRWDLVNDVALADFLPARTGYHIPNRQSLLVLSDGTIVISYIKVSDLSVSILHYNAAGTLLHTYDFADTLDGGENTLICSTLQDPSTFLAWEHLSNHISRFRTITVASGASVFVDSYQFSSGVYDYTPTATPSAFFGNADSCPVLIMRTFGIGSIYKIVPNKRNDTIFVTGDVKIPDPLFKTGLLGG